MPEAESKGFNLPWAPLLALVAAIAGLSALLPSHSARPPAAETEVSLPRHKGISARLWQDPLEVVIEAEARRVKDSKDAKDSSAGKPGWKELETEYGALKLNGQSPLVLMVCVPDSPYAEDVERRLRDRAALLQAMSAENYVPRHSKTLRYVVSDDCAFPDYPLPFESFGPFSNADQAPNTPPRNILVVWLGDGYLGEEPLRGLARVVGHLIDSEEPDAFPEFRQPPEVRVLGPSTSGQYRKMLEELDKPVRQDFEETKFHLSRAQLFSCKATGADPILRKGIDWLNHDPGDTASALQRRMRAFSDSRFSFSRTTPTDDLLCGALWWELMARHIGSHAHIAVLSELDSFYGHASIDTFVASRLNPDAQGSPHVHAYYYMAGIDGALPKSALGAEDKTAKEQSPGEKAPAHGREATEGLSQVDYFRRLADSLAQENQRLIASGNPIDAGGFRAVVVLGSDIYDKLQILRTLRPRLPTALFLTDGLDARFGHPDEWDETRNLIVAAGQPLILNWPDKGHLPAPFDSSPLPFRDSIQTSVYLAARHALHAADQTDMGQDTMGDWPAKDWRGRPQLFEIGKRSPVALGVNDQSPGSLRLLSLIIAIAALIAILCLIISNIAPPPGAPVPVSRWQRFYLGMSRTYLAAPAALILSGAVTWVRWFLQHDHRAPEPFALFDGISIWPGDFLRLLVFLLAIHFVCKILVDLKANVKTLSEDFGIDSPLKELPALPGQPKPSTIWQRIALIRNQLWPHYMSSDPVDAHALMERYCYWTRPWKRFLRAAAYLALYLILLSAILSAFPSSPPVLPVRGDAFGASMGILFAASFATLVVTFLIFDATMVNCLFIRELNSGRTDWGLSTPIPPKSPFKFRNHLAVLDPDDCSDYLDIQYIARRSDVVNRLIYFPFILIALLLVARSSTTDGYTWTPMLLVGIALNISWVAFCAIRLPVEAQAARSDTVRRLRHHLFLLRAEEATKTPPLAKPNSVALEAVITEIENLRRGAFLGIWEQPLLRAFLVPSGGVGLSALLDLIPH